MIDSRQVNFDAYFRSVYARRHTAVPMGFRSVSIKEWSPERASCHTNVEYFVLHHQALNRTIRAVRGWVLIIEDECGRCMFAAHSMVEMGGELFDITIADPHERKGLRFLPHDGTDELFCAVADRFPYLLYPFIAVEELTAAGYVRGASEDPVSN